MKTLNFHKTRAIAFGACITAIAACSNQPVGSELDDGGFGFATRQNHLAQICYGAGGAKYGGGKLSSAADPLVVLDPSATPQRPMYRVHCDGNLDGKYALINYREYVASGTQKTTVRDSDAE